MRVVPVDWRVYRAHSLQKMFAIVTNRAGKMIIIHIEGGFAEREIRWKGGKL